jgi:hypothetical protein
MSSPKDKSPLKAELAARAEAKLEIQATVPEKSVGRLVDAITDIFRPFSESRGLKADQIRLQREDVAIEIAIKARERLNIEDATIRPVPNKILVPLIEAASCEASDDTYMQNIWANLLASAATEPEVEPRFVGILRELQGTQARALERLALNEAEMFEFPKTVLAEAPFDLASQNLQRIMTDVLSEFDDDTAIPYAMDKVEETISRPGGVIVDIIGVCRQVTAYLKGHKFDEMIAIYYHITEMGVRFFQCCHKMSKQA